MNNDNCFKYLHLWGPLYPRFIPRDLWKHLYKIRPVEDWVMRGFRIKVDKCMNVAPLSLKQIGFIYSWVNHIDDKIQYAIDHDKIHIDNPTNLYIFTTQGFGIDDFAPLDADFLFYIEAVRHFLNKEYDQAKDMLEKAVTTSTSDWQEYKYLREDIELALRGERALFHILGLDMVHNARDSKLFETK